MHVHDPRNNASLFVLGQYIIGNYPLRQIPAPLQHTEKQLGLNQLSCSWFVTLCLRFAARVTKPVGNCMGITYTAAQGKVKEW